MSEYSHSRAMEAARELFPAVETHGPERSTEQFAKLAQGLLQTHEWAAEIILKHMEPEERGIEMSEKEGHFAGVPIAGCMDPFPTGELCEEENQKRVTAAVNEQLGTLRDNWNAAVRRAEKAEEQVRTVTAQLNEIDRFRLAAETEVDILDKQVRSQQKDNEVYAEKIKAWKETLASGDLADIAARMRELERRVNGN